MGKHKSKPNYRRRVLRLPDLDHCKLAVLNSLGSPASRRVYEHAIDQFVAWYCSEPRLAFNRIVVVRYRMYLESRGLAANTINQQLAAVRRLAHEAADSGLLSPELAAGISRVKGVKQLGFRAGNWLSAEQSSEVLTRACGDSMRAKRDYAMLAMLFGCGFRRSELVGLELNDIQMRQGHWAVVDLIGKGGHIRTVPIPNWVKAALDQWTRAAEVSEGKIFRAVARLGKVWGRGISQNVVWYVVRTCCQRAGLERIAPHDLRRTCAKLCHDRAEDQNMSGPSATPQTYLYRNEPIWSRSERGIARRIFDAALKRELHQAMQETKQKASRIKEARDLWALERHLTDRRKDIDRKYDFRVSRLTRVFGTLFVRRSSH